MTRRAWIAGGLVATIALLAGCDIGESGGESRPVAPPSSDAVAAPAELDTSILPTRTEPTDVAVRVADGVVPPTNRWYSGLVFSDQAYPAFTSPLSYQSTENGFAWGVPHVGVAVDGNAIVSPASTDVTVVVDGAAGLPIATAADPVSVTLAYADVDVTVAAGSPVISLVAQQDATLTVTPAPTPHGEGLWLMEVGKRTYGIVADTATVDGPTITMGAGDDVQMFALPDGGDPTAVADAITAPVGSVDVGFLHDGDQSTTSLGYVAEGESTLIAVPRARAEGLNCELGTYPSVNGELVACGASAVSWSVPAVEPTLQLDLSDIAPERRAEIVAALEQEAQTPPQFRPDSYFGSKALHRHALLVTTADAVGETALADQFASELAEELRVWADPAGCERRASRCFEYDEQLRGVVGVEPAYGSEKFNDHHFHYGYLLNAAAIAVERDPSLEEILAPVIDLVAADIASPPGSADFPALRAFDPYAGHSWASGFAPFGDGNNQESSSEAVLAWNGVAAWAQVREDESLARTAQWMLSAEADAAVKRWLRPDLEAFEDYDHDIVSIVWGGKREYSTWFSDESSAKLAIELIPMAPIQRHLAPEDDDAVATALRSIDAAVPEGYEMVLGDYVLMYRALAGPDEASAAWNAAVALPDDAIDNGNSRAAMLAWIAALE